MQIVIEIPEKYRGVFEKSKCKEKFDSLATNEFGYVLRKAFENGIPLPKDHGRIMDVDAVVKAMYSRKPYDRLTQDDLETDAARVETALNIFGKTIIPADKESEREK